MTLLKVQKIVATASSAGPSPELRKLSPSPASDSGTAFGAQQTDALDALMQSLSAEDPAFGDMLIEASKELALLATDGEGRPTLTSLRMSAGLTQKQLADKISQKQSNVSLMESGLRVNVQRETMKRMCSALGCDMNTLDAAIDSTVVLLDVRNAQQEAEHSAAQAADGRLCA